MITVSIDLSELRADVRDAYQQLGNDLRDGVTRTLRAGHTTARSLAPRKTGHLIDTTEGRVNSTGPQGTEGELVSTAHYASYVTDGTRPHEITPRRGRTRKGGPSMLRWEDGGGVHFARKVMH